MRDEITPTTLSLRYRGFWIDINTTTGYCYCKDLIACSFTSMMDAIDRQYLAIETCFAKTKDVLYEVLFGYGEKFIL